MADLVVKQGDTWPPLDFTLTDAVRAITSIAKSGSTVTVTTASMHLLTTGDYVYLDGTTNFSDGIARAITVTGVKAYTYQDTDGTAKATETSGTSSRAVDLTSATTIRFLARGTQVLITGSAVKDANQTAKRGKGTYTFITGDTAVVGDYDVEFEVNWGGGKIETFPNQGYRSMTITDDLA